MQVLKRSLTKQKDR